MEIIISEKSRKIVQNKRRLEKELGIKITNRGNEIKIDGPPLNEYFAKNAIEAINFGFSIQDSLLLKKENFIFEILNIKNYTRSKNLERVRGRIIGKGGRTLKVLSNITDCKLEMKNNELGIIGDSKNMKTIQEALINLIKGSKQSNVYSFLEKHQSKPILDLGLKD